MTDAKTVSISPQVYSYLESQAQLRSESIERILEFIVKEFAKAGERAFIEQLRKEGLLVSVPTALPGSPRNFKPVPIEGEPLSQTIIEDRR